MSTVISKQVQVGTSGTATDNFTIFQPATPDGTLRIGNGNTGITTSLVALTSAGNLGVGTATPGTRLDAYASGTTSTILRARNDTTSVYLDANNGYSYLNTFSNHPMLFGTNNVERMRIDASGNVGIGKSNPQALLDYRLTINVISTNTTAVASRTYVFTANLTLTLPASPTAGDMVMFANRSATSTPVIARNGQNIMGLAEDMTVNNVNYFGTLVFSDATHGWIFQ